MEESCFYFKRHPLNTDVISETLDSLKYKARKGCLTVAVSQCTKCAKGSAIKVVIFYFILFSIYLGPSFEISAFMLKDCLYSTYTCKC